MHYSVILFLSNLFSSDMVIIVFVALLLFGGEKLPEIARGLGKGIRDFKDASEGVKREINNQINSFEEKKEDKKIEEAIIANQLAATTTGPVVENTVPVNENNLNGSSQHKSESPGDGHFEQVTNTENINRI